LATGLEHRLEGLDAVVGRLEKEVVDDGLRLLQLLHQRQRHRPARHRAAELRIDAIARRPAKHGHSTLLARLEEVRRFRGGGSLLRRSALLLGHDANVVMCTL
jgi:hypothetical protein